MSAHCAYGHEKPDSELGRICPECWVETNAKLEKAEASLLSMGAALALMRDALDSISNTGDGQSIVTASEALDVPPTHYEQYVKALEEVAKAAQEVFTADCNNECFCSALVRVSLARLDQLRVK